MFYDDLMLLAVALAFGAWLGWAMALRPSEKKASITALITALVLGVGTWILGGADPLTRHGQAAISLTIGPAVALAVLQVRLRRGGAPQ